jgi:hypothetical protein
MGETLSSAPPFRIRERGLTLADVRDDLARLARARSDVEREVVPELRQAQHEVFRREARELARRDEADLRRRDTHEHPRVHLGHALAVVRRVDALIDLCGELRLETLDHGVGLAIRALTTLATLSSHWSYPLCYGVGLREHLWDVTTILQLLGCNYSQHTTRIVPSMQGSTSGELFAMTMFGHVATMDRVLSCKG